MTNVILSHLVTFYIIFNAKINTNKIRVVIFDQSITGLYEKAEEIKV